MKEIEIKRFMKKYHILLLCSIWAMYLCSGCSSGSGGVIKGDAPVFMPAELEISRAFSGIRPQTDSTNFQINVYVRILDQFGDSLKLPGKFRIELYQKVSNTNESNLGERLNINEEGYVEFDLSTPDNNQKYWDRISSSYALNFTVNNAPSEVAALVTWFYNPNYRLTNTIDLEKK